MNSNQTQFQNDNVNNDGSQFQNDNLTNLEYEFDYKKQFDINDKMKDSNNKIFIHFESKEECDNFIKTSKNSIFGHRCCYGKGVHIKIHNNKEITCYDQVKKIKNLYINKI